MPVRTERCPGSAAACVSSASLIPPPPINTQQPGVATSLLYSGSQFRGHQKSKGNSYDVEVVLQVTRATLLLRMSSRLVCCAPVIWLVLFRNYETQIV